MKWIYGIAAAAVLSWASAAAAQNASMTVPDVNVTAPSATAPQPPYLQNPGTGGSLRNPFNGRYRNEEDKFVQQPCGTTRLAAAGGGGTCPVGYRLDGGPARYGTNCDMGLDVVMFNAGAPWPSKPTSSASTRKRSRRWAPTANAASAPTRAMPRPISRT